MKPTGGITSLLSAVSDAVVLVDSQRQVVFMNPEAVNLTGFSAEDASGKDLWEICVLINQNTRKPVTDDIDGVLKRDGYFNFPLATVIIPDNGSELLIRGAVFLSDDNKMGSDVIEGVIFRNVSSRWLIDTTMQKSQKAETIRILAGGIADNLKDLLTVLLAQMSGIRKNHDDRTSVFRSIRESKKIIGKISSMVSSLSPGKDDDITGSNNICLVEKSIRSSMEIFSAAFPQVDIKMAYPDRTGYVVIPQRLVEQIVVNLLINAGEAISGNGNISITACRIDLLQDIKPISAGSYVMISVSDDGCGISDENLTRIFDPFYSTRKKKGGLGLSAVYSIVNSYNGYITLESELGEGSSFTFYLPAAPGIVTETASDVIPRISIEGFKKVEEQLLRKILEAAGCTVFPLSTENMEDTSASVDAEVPEYNMLLTDYDFYMSEINRFKDLDLLDKGIIAVVNESYHVPDNADPNVTFVTRPVRIDNIAGSVAKCAWARPAKSEKASRSED